MPLRALLSLVTAFPRGIEDAQRPGRVQLLNQLFWNSNLLNLGPGGAAWLSLRVWGWPLRVVVLAAPASIGRVSLRIGSVIFRNFPVLHTELVLQIHRGKGL